MSQFIRGRVRLARLTAWLEADARQWTACRCVGQPTDAALATLDAAFDATFGGAPC
jgi:hypothetical protein